MRRMFGVHWLALAVMLAACSGGDPAGGGPPPSACASAGATCSAPSGCCTGDCLGGYCAMSSAGEPCATAADCQPSLACVSGLCKSASCFADDATCSFDSQCCTLNCRGNKTCGVNRPPVASAGPDANTFKRTTTTLDGSGSSDPDGDTLTYSWTLTGPAGSSASLSSRTAQKPTFESAVTGAYVATLTVTDGLLSATDWVTVTLVDRPPVADLGASREVPRNSFTILSGSLSSDPDGDWLQYTWNLTSRPAGSTATLREYTSPSDYYFTPDLLGDYGVTLVVSDGTLTSEASIVVTAVNAAPTAEIQAWSEANAGAPVSASGSASRDPNSDPITYAWQLTAPAGSTAALSTTTGVDTSFTPDLPGAYALSLTVSDGVLASAPATKTVTVHSRVVLTDYGIAAAVYDDLRDTIVMSTTAVWPSICFFHGLTQTYDCQLVNSGGAMLSLAVSADGGAYAYGRVGAVGWNRVNYAGWYECPLTWVDGSGVSHPFEAASVSIGPQITVGSGKDAHVTRFLHATPSGTATGGGDVLTVDTALCAQSIAGSLDAGFDGAGARRPGTETLYVLDGAGAGKLRTWDLSVLPAPLPAPTLATPAAPPGNRFWFYDDGSRLVTNEGRVFESGLSFDGSTYALPSAGLLGNPGATDPAPLLLHADHSAAAGLIAAIPATGTSPTPLDVEVRQFSATDFTQAAPPRVLPPIARDGVAHPAFGRYVFFKRDGTKLYVFQQAAPGTATAGVATLDP